MMNKIKYLTLITLLTVSQSLAQYGSVGVTDARSMGLGKTYNACSRGVYSLGINPSNLVYSKNMTLDFATVLPLPQVSVKTGTNFMSLEDFNYYFGGVNGEARQLTEDDKKGLNNLFEDGGTFFVYGTTHLLSASYNVNPLIGAFGFSISDYASSSVTIPHAVVDVAMTGNPAGHTYDFNDGQIKMWWLRNYSLSYAREIPVIFFKKFAAGISFKLVHGFSYVGTQKNDTYFSTGSRAEITGHADLIAQTAFSDNFGVKYDFDSLSKKSEFNIFPSPAGNGFGFDFGFSVVMDRWRFSLALTDLGQIKWTENTAEFSSFGRIYIDDLTNNAQRDSIEEILTGTNKKLDHFYTPLATALRAGASYFFQGGKTEFPGTLLLVFDYNQGFNDYPGNSTVPRFSIGSEWKPMDWIPYLRTGFSLGGGTGFSWAFGIGVDINIVELHLATSDLQGFISPHISKELAISLGSRWKI